MDFFKCLAYTTVRYIKIDFRYKFQVLIDGLWSVINAIAFGFMGTVFSSAGLPPGMSLRAFLLFGAFYWTVFTTPYEETVITIPEEASKGTIGSLLTNRVSIPALLLGRMLSSLLKSTFIALVFCLPILLFYVQDQLQMIMLEFVPWFVFISVFTTLFMLAITLFVSSYNLIFKRIGVLSRIFLYGLKIATGMYFPPESLPTWLAPYVMLLPPVAGLTVLRDLLILGEPAVHLGWMAAEYLNITILSLTIGTAIMGVVALFALTLYSNAARKLGTIEHY